MLAPTRSAVRCPRAVRAQIPCEFRRCGPMPTSTLESGRQGNVDVLSRLSAYWSNLLRDEELAPRVVPIVADEARTFGMASLFRQVGIYSPAGQLYEPEDKDFLLAYREATDGQLLEEGITEAGAISSWAAAATAYSVSGIAMLPV